MNPTVSLAKARHDRLQRQLKDLESAIQSLELRKDTDEHARSEYYRLRVLWVRQRAVLDASSGERQ